MSVGKRKEWLNKIDYKKKCKMFLLPMLNTSLYHNNVDGVNYLIDVSLVQMGFPQMVVTFDNVDYIPLKEDIHRLSMSSEYVDSEYGDDEKEVNMFFDVPKIYKKDFELFTQGLYSQFSVGYKELLERVHGSKRNNGISPETSLPNVNIYDVIYPTDDLKKLMAKQLSTANHHVDWKNINEVLDPPKIELEEFKLVEELYGE
jgi:hypothetical protein